MADLIPKNTDEEMQRYMEADMIRRARMPMEGNAALKFEADPITGRENAYFPLSAGGYVKIGDRAVTPVQAAETDGLAAEREIQNDARGPINEVMGGADGPVMDDYLAAGFTEADVREYQAQERARMLAQPGMQVPVQLTPEQVQMGVDVGAPMFMPRAKSLRDRVQDIAYTGLKQFIDDPNDLRFWSNYLTDVADIMAPGVGGAMSVDEGARLFNQGVEQGNAVDMLVGGALTTLGVAEIVPLVRGLSEPARIALTENLSPAAKNLLADTIGASRAIAQGDREMLMEIFQPAGTPRSLGAAAPDTSYRMQHQPRGPQDDNPVRLDDLTKSTTGEPAGYPEDFYSSVGPRYYAPGPSFPGDEFGRANQESYRAIRAVRGNPDATVTIYRAVPDDPSITTINEGDFVTLSRTYAEMHGASGYGQRGEDAGKILEQEVKVKDIYWDGNDVNEFGYFPSSLVVAAPDPETAGAITAFHGSPYDFDAFDISRMGTGEGAQAYGPGLYFAEAEDIAKSYRDQLANGWRLEVRDPIREAGLSGRDLDSASQMLSTSYSGDAAAMDWENWTGKTLTPEQRAAFTEAFKRKGGRLYEVNIRANPEDFLNWDAPISQQSEKVREALMPFVEQRIAQMGQAGSRFTPEQWMDRLRGGDVMLLDKVGDTPVSRALADAGVPGVRYFDQGSRATAGGEILSIQPSGDGFVAKVRVNNRTGVGFQSPTTMLTTSRPFSTETEAMNWAQRKVAGGTRNIVVFDDQLIDIVKKYGVAGLAVGAAVQSELGGNQQIEENI